MHVKFPFDVIVLEFWILQLNKAYIVLFAFRFIPQVKEFGEILRMECSMGPIFMCVLLHFQTLTFNIVVASFLYWHKPLECFLSPVSFTSKYASALLRVKPIFLIYGLVSDSSSVFFFIHGPNTTVGHPIMDENQQQTKEDTLFRNR